MRKIFTENPPPPFAEGISKTKNPGPAGTSAQAKKALQTLSSRIDALVKKSGGGAVHPYEVYKRAEHVFNGLLATGDSPQQAAERAFRAVQLQVTGERPTYEDVVNRVRAEQGNAPDTYDEDGRNALHKKVTPKTGKTSSNVRAAGSDVPQIYGGQ